MNQHTSRRIGLLRISGGISLGVAVVLAPVSLASAAPAGTATGFIPSGLYGSLMAVLPFLNIALLAWALVATLLARSQYRRVMELEYETDHLRQMARVAGALGTGNLVTPRLNAAMPAEVSPLRFPERDMAVVREGMRMVVDGGTGRKAGEGVDANVIGKTGTAEVGRGASRRKNTWFIAYATPTETSVCRDPVAIAMVVENGESGGGTTAPKVAAVLRAIYNGTEDAGGV